MGRLATDLVLALGELDGPASTCLGHSLRLMVSSFNSLSEEEKRGSIKVMEKQE